MGRAIRYAPTDHTYDVWWFSTPGVDEQLVYWLRSLGTAAKHVSPTPMKIGYRLTSRRKMSEVLKVLRRRTHGDVKDVDISVREVASPKSMAGSDHWRKLELRPGKPPRMRSRDELSR